MRLVSFLAMTALSLMGGSASAQPEMYNIWVCEASPQYRTGADHLVFEGYSRLFPQGSGGGQQARVEAFQNARRACERSTNLSCHSRIEGCQVTRFALDGNGGGGHRGQWVPTRGQACQQVCATRGQQNGVSPEGAQCASGETRPASAMQAGISFVYGTWPSAQPNYNIRTSSFGGYCYANGQRRDNDRTDITVGCFCQ